MKRKFNFKFAGCLAVSVIWSCVAWSQSNKPSPPNPPKGKVQQTITRTTYVNPDQLEKGTEGKAGPPGLTLMCHLYAFADQGGPATNGPGECAFPIGAKLDRNYQQKQISCAGGGAQTPMSPQDIPPGIDLQCDGGYYWAVIPPVRLLALQFDNNGMVTQWGVYINSLYCGPGGAPNGGCNVKVDVYAKLK